LRVYDADYVVRSRMGRRRPIAHRLLSRRGRDLLRRRFSGGSVPKTETEVVRIAMDVIAQRKPDALVQVLEFGPRRSSAGVPHRL